MCLIALAAEPVEKDKVEETSESELLEFSKFDINRVLKHGERLVGSSGAEYDLPDEDLLGNENLYTIFKLMVPSLNAIFFDGFLVGNAFLLIKKNFHKNSSIPTSQKYCIFLIFVSMTSSYRTLHWGSY